MALIFPFVLGFLAGIVAVLFPGLINMTAARISLTEGKNRAMIYVLGALLVISIQTYIAVIFAQYIDKHKEVVVLLREIGLFVFVVLTVYFLKFAKNPELNPEVETPVKSKKGRFFMGMGISAINVLPIPYYVLISIAFASYQLFSFNPLPIYSLVSGVVAGSFVVFYFYVVFFNRMKSKADFLIKNINKLVGGITGVISLLTLFNLLKGYFN